MDDDLTASHWDDVLSPSKTAFTSSSHFHSLAINDPHRDSDTVDDYKGEEEAPEQDYNQEEIENRGQSMTSPFPNSTYASQQPYMGLYATSLVSGFETEDKRQKQTAIVDLLTHGVEDLSFNESTLSPRKIDHSAALFTDKDKGSPIKVPPSEVSAPGSPTRVPMPSGKSRLKRFRKYPPSTIVANMNSALTSIDDPLFSASANTSASTRVLSGVSERQKEIVKDMDAPLYNVSTSRIDDQDSQSEHRQTNNSTQNSSALEHQQENDLEHSKTSITGIHFPAKPLSGLGSKDNHLRITVGDPLKVGDITTAHIVYVIQTVNENPQSCHFSLPEASVSRRYRDFRWIYRQLQSNHPGKIVPPPPSKQTYIGRFNENFVENRRISLEKMLAKICKIPCLVNDPDFIMFLTSNDFAADSKEREKISGSAASHASLADGDNENSTPSVVSSGSGSQGLFSSIFSITPKIEEPDNYFANKKGYIEDLEFNLKTFCKSLEMIVTQRVETISVIEQLSSLFSELSELEMLKKTKELLSAFAEVNNKLLENLDRVNQQEQLTLGFTIEEYLRIIESIKYTFETRTKIYQQLHSFQLELTKKEESLERLNSKYKTSVDKINMVEFEVNKLQQKVAYFENSFKTISDTIRDELDTFETEKIDDFRNSVEIFIESSIESQKEAIETWETFYERHNLAAV